MIILGLETSCDETASAVLEHRRGKFKILSNIVSSQVNLHAKWGGVVPNLAAREHLKNIIPVISESLEQAKIKPSEIDLISVTEGPGLIPALLIGVGVAKTLSYLWQKPLLGVHHIEGHIYANFISQLEDGKIKFPILCLVVSGGHTQLVLMKKQLDYKIIGETLDDAAGEAFDKVARILNLGYPGGPIIAAHAAKIKNLKLKIINYKISLPRPMINSSNLNFSFSGLKTAVLYLVKKNKKLVNNKKFISEICAEFQQAVIDVLVSKTITAAKKFRPKTILLAGGVSANLELRKQLKKAVKSSSPQVHYLAPDIQYCLDNAAMIAAAGFYRWKENKSKTSWRKKLNNHWKDLEAFANLKLS